MSIHKSCVDAYHTNEVQTKDAYLVSHSFGLNNKYTKWNFAADDWHCPLAENDLRVGGKYHVRMEAKDGSFGFDLEAIYKSMDLGKGFVYMMSDERMVTVSMTREGNNTHIIIEFEAENVNSVELQRAGWQAILNNFKKHAETID